MPTQQRTIHTIDATGKVLGRLATQIVVLLRGKQKATFTPHIDDGDVVRVQNIGGMKVTGGKLDKKEYHHFTRYPGGYKSVGLKKLMKEDPADVLRRAVDGMLPKNRQRTGFMKRLTIE